MGLSGFGVLKMVESEMSMRAAILVLSWNLTKFRML
jgi:hypothetical protein